MIRIPIIAGLTLYLASPVVALEAMSDQALAGAEATGLMLDQLQAHLPRLEQQTLRDNAPERRLQAPPVILPDATLIRGRSDTGYARTQARSDPPHMVVQPVDPDRVEVELTQTVHHFEALDVRHTPDDLTSRGSYIGSGLRVQGNQTLTYHP